MDVVLYSTGCPNCEVLKKRLDSAGVAYTTINDEDLMISKGFMSAPVLEVDGIAMSFGNAIRWVKEQK